jgi:hypothetical protein
LRPFGISLGVAMKTTKIALGRKSAGVPSDILLHNCHLFRNDQTLLDSTYHVSSPVSIDAFRLFLAALSGETPEITAETASGLAMLCDEFGFSGLCQVISRFHGERMTGLEKAMSLVQQELASLTAETAELKLRISVLEQCLPTAVSRNAPELRVTNSQPSPLTSVVDHSSPAKIKWKFPPSIHLDGIIAHLTREFGGNVHNKKAVVVTSSRPFTSDPCCAPQNIVDLRSDSYFYSAHRSSSSEIPHTRNNWVCYDFRRRRIVPTHYSITSWAGYVSCSMSWVGCVGGEHLKNWAVEISSNGQDWIEIDVRENNCELNDGESTKTFEITRSQECRLIRLINIGRNHAGSDALVISAFEIFGRMIE